MKKLLFALPLILILSACSNTHLVSSWKAEDATMQTGEYRKVMVAAFIKDEETRVYTENRLSKTHSNFYPSNKYFATRDLLEDQDFCKKRLAEEGFDGMVTMQLVEASESEHWVPATYSGGYWGYAGIAYGGYYSPGYIAVDKNYVIRTNLFSLKQDKLLWSGVTATVNPTSINVTLDEIAIELRKRMIKDGFLAS